MKTVILLGRSGVGKTTLKQALNNEEQVYRKTQSIDWSGKIIDTPGEYCENRDLSSALGLYACEADTVALLLSADDWFSVYSPCMTGIVNREVIGIVTKTDIASPEKAKAWLSLAGCKKIFAVSAKTGEGIEELKKHLGQI